MNKKKLYEKAIKEIKKRVSKKDDAIVKMSTIVAVFKYFLPHYYACGFYFAEERYLVIGPYQGNVACPVIAYSGICGTSVKQKKTVIVPDVTKFPGYIECDAVAKSGIGIPIINEKGQVRASFYAESDELDAYDDVDKHYLETLFRELRSE